MNDSRDALEQACAAAGIDAGGARLLRVGSNAVYRLKPPVIVRVSRPGADAGQVRRTVAVARWLEAARYPAVRAVDVDQPVAADGHLVTFWDAVSDDGDQYASTAEVAEVLVELAAECGADLLVIGNKGMHRRVLASVPNTVTHRAPCSVLVVKTT